MFAKIRFSIFTCLQLKDVNCLATKSFGVFALEVDEILQAMPPKLRREMGMCDNAGIKIYVQQYYTSTRSTGSSLAHLVPGAANLVPGTRYMQAPNLLQNQRYEGLFRA